MEFLIDVAFNTMAVTFALSVLWLGHQTIRTVRRYVTESHTSPVTLTTSPKEETPAPVGCKELTREVTAIRGLFGSAAFNEQIG